MPSEDQVIEPAEAAEAIFRAARERRFTAASVESDEGAATSAAAPPSSAGPPARPGRRVIKRRVTLHGIGDVTIRRALISEDEFGHVSEDGPDTDASKRMPKLEMISERADSTSSARDSLTDDHLGGHGHSDDGDIVIDEDEELHVVLLQSKSAQHWMQVWHYARSLSSAFITLTVKSF